MDLIEHVKKIGLNEKEAKIYLALLESGGGTVQDIAKKSGLKRTTIYPFLTELVRRNYVSTIKQESGRHFYISETPDRLLGDLKLRVKDFRNILPVLNSIIDNNRNKPKTFFFCGKDAYKKFYDDTLNIPKNSLICEFIGMAEPWKYLPIDYVSDYFKKRVAKKIKVKTIATDSPESRGLLKDAAKCLREIILVPPGHFDLSGALEIYGNRVSVISWSEDFTGFIIESKRMADMLKLAFEMMWQGAKLQAVEKFEFVD